MDGRGRLELMATKIWPLTPLITDDLADTRTSSMRSTVKILAYTAGANDRYNRPTSTWADPATVDPLPAGARASSTRDAAGQAQIPLWDWEIFVPLGTVVDPRDKVLLVNHNGTAVSVELAIMGQPETGPTAVRLKCRLVTEE